VRAVRASPWQSVAGDALLAAVMTGLMVLAAGTSGDEPSRPLDAGSVVAIGAVGVWTALARRAPRATVVGAVLTFYAILAFGVPAFSPALALGVPVFVAAWTGHLRWGAAVLVVMVATSPYRVVGPGPEPYAEVAVHTLYDLALVGVLLLLGEALRSRRELRRSAELRLLLSEREHQQQLTDERIRVTRDLHDVLAHTVAMVSIQANVAAESLDTDPEQARTAIDRVRDATREAAADLRSTIRVLRHGGEDDREPTLGTAQLPELLDGFRAAGLDTHLTVTGSTEQLRPSVDLTVYRIVQESLTNVLRHTAARTVDVAVTCRDDVVDVRVGDDGSADRAPGVTTPEGTGSGLKGMTERVRALGGQLEHGPVRGDHGEGHEVRARIPLGEET